jgi:hypothetical protein
MPSKIDARERAAGRAALPTRTLPGYAWLSARGSCAFPAADEAGKSGKSPCVRFLLVRPKIFHDERSGASMTHLKHASRNALHDRRLRQRHPGGLRRDSPVNDAASCGEDVDQTHQSGRGNKIVHRAGSGRLESWPAIPCGFSLLPTLTVWVLVEPDRAWSARPACRF